MTSCPPHGFGKPRVNTSNGVSPPESSKTPRRKLDERESRVAPSDQQSDESDSAGVARLPGLRFIPFRRSDLLRMLRSDVALSRDDNEPFESDAFERGVARIEAAFTSQFHDQKQAIKELYGPFDPDADTRLLRAVESEDAIAAQLATRLAALLDRANYERLTQEQLQRAFRSASLFKIRLRVDMRDFDDVLLYCRGASRREETLYLLFGLIKRRVVFINYDRVVLYLRYADRNRGEETELPPGRVMIKLFQNVPEADLEMLFPNTRVGMRWIDRLLIGVPAVASGVVVATTKLGAPLLLLAGLLGFWLGLREEPVSVDMRGLIVIGAGIGAIGAYIYKQWSSYRNRKARFRQALTRNLYFRLLDNNAGVLLRVLDDAEDAECKEAFVALRFLLTEKNGVSAEALDTRIEEWFCASWQARLDFEIADALQKLANLGLAYCDDDLWYAGAMPARPEVSTQ